MASPQQQLPPRGESAQNMALVRLLNEEFARYNLKGMLSLCDRLRQMSYAANEKRVRWLVRLTG